MKDTARCWERLNQIPPLCLNQHLFRKRKGWALLNLRLVGARWSQGNNNCQRSDKKIGSFHPSRRDTRLGRRRADLDDALINHYLARWLWKVYPDFTASASRPIQLRTIHHCGAECDNTVHGTKLAIHKTRTYDLFGMYLPRNLALSAGSFWCLMWNLAPNCSPAPIKTLKWNNWNSLRDIILRLRHVSTTPHLSWDLPGKHETCGPVLFFVGPAS